MTIGHYVGKADGDQDFYENAPASVFCPTCGSVVDKTYLPTFLKLSRKARSQDIFATYDGKTLVSERGAHFFRHAFGESCELRSINADVPIYVLTAKQVVQFDSDRRETRFSNWCLKCRSYEGVHGATPCFLKVIEPLEHGLYRTDLEFGYKSSKHPLLIVGATDAKTMQSFKPHGGGLYLESIEA
jgi:hypothetical protein